MFIALYHSFLYNCMLILQWVLLGSDVGCCSLTFREIPKLKLFQYQFHNSMKSFIKCCPWNHPHNCRICGCNRKRKWFVKRHTFKIYINYCYS